jgi:hypothetical protein
MPNAKSLEYARYGRAIYARSKFVISCSSGKAIIFRISLLNVILRPMYSVRARAQLHRYADLFHSSKCAYATTSYGTPAQHASRITEADVNAARSYCANLLQ